MYVAVQLAGAFAGVAAAHLMFGEALFTASLHVRSGRAQIFSEFVATFGLLSVICGCSRFRPSSVPFAVGAYITAAYWFTASTSFANGCDGGSQCDEHLRENRPADARFIAPNCWEQRPRLFYFAGSLLLFAFAMCRFAILNPPDDYSETRAFILCTGNSARSQMAEGLLPAHARDRGAARRHQAHARAA
jgi:hypothetical protein